MGSGPGFFKGGGGPGPRECSYTDNRGGGGLNPLTPWIRHCVTKHMPLTSTFSLNSLLRFP